MFARGTCAQGHSKKKCLWGEGGKLAYCVCVPTLLGHFYLLCTVINYLVQVLRGGGGGGGGGIVCQDLNQNCYSHGYSPGGGGGGGEAIASPLPAMARGAL